MTTKSSPVSTLVKEIKSKLLDRLLELDIVESDLIVATVRKHRPNLVGYYSNMSQFRGKARIVVDADHILDHYFDAADARLEIYRTIAHEYGHMIAEAIRETPRLSNYTDAFDVPPWQQTFENEELFAESFADFCCEPEECNKNEFWVPFMAAYSLEFDRLFADEDQEKMEKQHDL